MKLGARPDGYPAGEARRLQGSCTRIGSGSTALRRLVQCPAGRGRACVRRRRGKRAVAGAPFERGAAVAAHRRGRRNARLSRLEPRPPAVHRVPSRGLGSAATPPVGDCASPTRSQLAEYPGQRGGSMVSHSEAMGRRCVSATTPSMIAHSSSPIWNTVTSDRYGSASRVVACPVPR